MKVFRNEILKGRKELELTIRNEQGGDDKMDYRTILKLVALNGLPKEALNLDNMRKVNKILDQLEKEEEEKSDIVSLEDSWNDLLRPHVEKFLVDFYRHHAPFVIDQIAGFEVKEDAKKTE